MTEDSAARPAARLPRLGRPELLLVLALLLTAFGALLVKESSGAPTISWMRVFQPRDIDSFQDLRGFLVNLRVPIPPVIAAAEIVSTQWTGSTRPVTVWGYRAAFVGSFVLALILTYPSLPRMLGAYFLSLVFLLHGVVIHAGNPMVYDVFWPFFVLAYLVLFECGRRWAVREAAKARSWRGPAGIGLLVLAGASLSMAELSRPFFIFLMPVPLAAAAYRLRRLGRRCLWAFFVPLFLLSGTWHGHQLASFGQVAWSNHSGFNLSRAWPMVERPELIDEGPSQRIRRSRLNQPAHGENSRRLQRAVLSYVYAHPWQSARHVADRLRSLLVDVKLNVYRSAPEIARPGVFRGTVRLTVIFLAAGTVALVGRAARSRDRLGLLLSAEGQLLWVTWGAALFLAVGERGEEARFLVSLLPFFATLPLPPALGRDLRERR